MTNFLWLNLLLFTKHRLFKSSEKYFNNMCTTTTSFNHYLLPYILPLEDEKVHSIRNQIINEFHVNRLKYYDFNFIELTFSEN